MKCKVTIEDGSPKLELYPENEYDKIIVNLIKDEKCTLRAYTEMTEYWGWGGTEQRHNIAIIFKEKSDKPLGECKIDTEFSTPKGS